LFAIFHFKKGGVPMNLFILGVSFGEGNKKIGDVFTFSLPSKITCPGKSIWCQKYCNAARFERLRPSCNGAYERNLLLTKNQDRFTDLMIGILPRILPCFRIHVSGDFWSQEYINSWIKICNTFPQTKFWTYTRSWTVQPLLEPLEQLNNLPNIQVFASTDPSMPLPPKEWRTAFIKIDQRATGVICPQEKGKISSCLQCGYCFNKEKGNVILKVK